jgi:hypothetical protein
LAIASVHRAAGAADDGVDANGIKIVRQVLVVRKQRRVAGTIAASPEPLFASQRIVDFDRLK